MRRNLMWALSLSVALTIVALWGQEAPRLVSALEPRLHEIDLPVGPATGNSKTAAVELPTELPLLSIEPAKRDVFAPRAPLPQPAVVTAAPPPQPQPVQPPAPTPQAPELNLRFLGNMVTPAGQRLVYLARGDAAVPVAVGDRLDEGYVVTSLTADAVTLVYPPLDVRVTLPISRAPQQQ